MNPLHRKVLLDLFVTPWSLLPAAMGVNMAFWAWMTDYPLGYMYAAVSILIGIGVALTRLVFCLDSITQNAVEQMNDLNQGKDRQRIETLEKNLYKYFKDSESSWSSRPKKSCRGRGYALLKQLLELEDDFKDTVGDSKDYMANMMRDKVEQLHLACIVQLEQYLSLIAKEIKYKDPRKSRRHPIEAKSSNDRVRIADEISEAISHLRKSIDEMKDLKKRNNGMDLSSLAQELDRTLEVARKAEHARRALDGERPLDE